MFPFGSPADIDKHIRDVVARLGMKEGGLMLTAECAPDVPLENIEAICQAMEKYRTYYA
jgi:uroporphyrinogen-III decarboxylase